jgi:hypothetical protein
MSAKPRKSSCKSARHPRRDGTIDSFHLRATRMPRFPLMNQLSAHQVAQFQSLAAVYRAALLDPGTWEALLLLLEICKILDLLPTVVERIFGEGVRARVETWSGEIHPRRPPPPAAGAIRRVWIWWPNAPGPVLCKILDDGTIARMTEPNSGTPA